MMIRVPSNRSLTPIARKGFRAPSGLAIALRNGTCRPKFRLWEILPAAETLSFHRGLRAARFLYAPSPSADRLI
jgi:hypothetical protein